MIFLISKLIFFLKKKILLVIYLNYIKIINKNKKYYINFINLKIL